MHERSASPDKTLQIFEGYHHDLINDQGHGRSPRESRGGSRTGWNPEHRHQIGIAYINA